MGVKRLDKIKSILVLIVSAMVMLLGLGNLIVYLPLKSEIFSDFENNYSFLSLNAYALQKSFSVIIGFILIMISYRLSKRITSAWVLTISLVTLSLCLHLLKFHRIHIINATSAAEVIILFLLILLFREFDRESSPRGIKSGLILAASSILFVVLYTAVGLFMIKRHFYNIDGWPSSILGSAQLFYFMDVSAVQPKGPMAIIFAHSAVLLNWLALSVAVILVMKPLIYLPIVTKFDKVKVRELLKLYDDNPISYVAMGNDKKYFFGSAVQGVIAYTIVRKVAVCAGDSICKEDETVLFLSEFMSFCRRNDYQICFCQITERLVNHFKALGFGISKYGEECMFELEKYSLEGSEASRIRQAVRKAERIGIQVFEYSPSKERDKELEKQITDVSAEWLKSKKSGEMTFMLGSVSLDSPYDRRYFIAVDESDIVQGFIVFTPFLGGRGYMADVTRRRNEAPFGVMEKLTVDAFLKMKNEGVKWGSLGLAPLYNVKNEENKGIVNDAFNYIFENLNLFYGFKSLYQYKRKYVPTSWESRYLAYYPKLMTPQIAYSLVKSQNPRGMSDYLITNLKKVILNLKSMRNHP